MKKTNVITPMWEKCRKALDENNLELADDLLMTLIFKLGEYTIKGFKDGDVIERVKLSVWKERAWMGIENAGLLD